MKKYLIISFIAILVLTTVTVGYKKYFATNLPDNVTVYYNVYYTDPLALNAEPELRYKRIRVQDSTGKWSIENTLIDENSTKQNYVAIPGNGLYEVDHVNGKLYYQDTYDQYPGPISTTNLVNSPDFQGTETICDYVVYKAYNETSKITTYYSPELDVFLKIDFGNGTVSEADTVAIDSAQDIILPAYSDISYDEYKNKLYNLQLDGKMTQAEVDERYLAIPEPYRSASFTPEICGE